MTKPIDLPKSDDEYWEGDTEKYTSPNIVTHVCPTHTKENWMTHVGYIDNKDGTASCEKCNWGFRIPGYIRVYNKRVVDLRDR
jgi:hypothetical protein